MKFNTGIILTDRFGKVVEEKDSEGNIVIITLGIVAVRAIDLQLPQDKDIKPEEMRKLDNLACKIMSQTEVELTAREIVTLQERVCNFNALIAGQLIRALDGE